MCVSLCVYILAVAQGSQKRVLDLLKLEWRVSLSCLTWELGI